MVQTPLTQAYPSGQQAVPQTWADAQQTPPVQGNASQQSASLRHAVPADTQLAPPLSGLASPRRVPKVPSRAPARLPPRIFTNRRREVPVARALVISSNR